MAAAVIALVGCKKHNDPEPTQEPTPEPTSSDTFTVYFMSDCITDNVKYTYTDNNGDTKTLTKENWVDLDKEDATDQAFVEDVKILCEVYAIEFTDEVIGHIKKFTVPNQPQMPVMKNVVKANNAELPEIGVSIVCGLITPTHPRKYATVFKPMPDATEDEKWEMVLDIAKRIF